MVKVLVSHASTDQKIIKPFIDYLIKIGINDNQLVYTSCDNTGTPLREDFCDYLKNEFIENDLIVVFMISDNFFKSEMCLNEMGAAWVNECIYYFMFLPGFNLTNESFKKCALNPRSQGIHYNNKDRAIEFINDLKKELDFDDVEDINTYVSHYIEEMDKMHKELTTPPVANIFKRTFIF